MHRQHFDPLDKEVMEQLTELIAIADSNEVACFRLFQYLGLHGFYFNLWFRTNLPTTVQRVLSFPLIDNLHNALKGLDKFVRRPSSVVMLPIFAYSIIPGSATLIFAVLAFWAGYERWMLAEKNRNVDDAIRRKELANKMIIDHANILRPFVSNVFEMEERFSNTMLKPEERVRLHMYIFTEIDNLEFVFDKARSGLILPQYALRAIKIFAARCENFGFEQLARELIKNGRYNRDFVRCAECLLDLGYWTRSRQSATD